MNNKNLFLLRVREKLSVEDLSSILDVPVENIRAWENEEKEPTATELKKLAAFYNVSIDYLLGIGEPVVRQVQPAQNAAPAQTYVQPKAEKKKRGPILHKGWYIAIPSAIVAMFILMACPFWDITNLSLFYVTFETGWATGICTLVFDGLFLFYFSVILFLNRKNLAKLNIANEIILASCFLVNLVLPIVVLVQAYGSIGFCGVLLLIVWFALAAYCAFLAILALVRFNQPAPEEVRIAEANAKLVKSKAEKEELAKQKKIERLTPAAKEERVAKAVKVKIRPWLTIISLVLVVLVLILSHSLNHAMAEYDPYNDVYNDIYISLSGYLGKYQHTAGTIFYTGLVASFVFALINFVIGVCYAKKKRCVVATCGAIFEGLTFAASALSLAMIIFVNVQCFHDAVTYTYWAAIAVTWVYSFVRLITCSRKAVILNKAKYLY